MIYRVLFSFLLGLLFMGSCVYHKNSLLLKDNSTEVKDTFQLAGYDSTEYRLQVGDMLSIKLSSPEKSSIEQFDMGKEGDGGYGERVYSAYIVDKMGNITFPLLGDLYVQGMTVSEVKNMLKNKLDVYYKYLTVIVRLVSFRVTIIGEVERPATFSIAVENTNFFEAISKVGGLTDFANTKHVKIVRKTETRAEIIRVDIGQAAFLESSFFYLRPNDIVYIPPLRTKVNRNNLQIVTAVVSIVSLLSIVFIRVGN